MKGYIHVKKKVHTPNMLQDIPYEELQFCAKNEINPGNRFRDIKSFHMYRENWRMAPIAALLDFLKILTKNIYCPLKGYIGAKNEVNSHVTGSEIYIDTSYLQGWREKIWPAWQPILDLLS